MKRDKLIIKISKLVLILWLIFSILVSIIIKQTINLKDIYLSIVIYSILFIPIYLSLFSLPFNKKYFERFIKSTLALIPTLFSYYLLNKQIYYINYNIVYIIVMFVIIFLLNFSLTNKKSNIFLILLTIFFSASSFIIYYLVHLNTSNYLVKNTDLKTELVDSTLIIITIIGIVISFINHLLLLNNLRKEDKYAGNSRS